MWPPSCQVALISTRKTTSMYINWPSNIIMFRWYVCYCETIVYQILHLFLWRMLWIENIYTTDVLLLNAIAQVGDLKKQYKKNEKPKSRNLCTARLVRDVLCIHIKLQVSTNQGQLSFIKLCSSELCYLLTCCAVHSSNSNSL